jgi:hypothetical protein
MNRLITENSTTGKYETVQSTAGSLNTTGGGGGSTTSIIKGNDGDDGAGTNRTIKTNSLGQLSITNSDITSGNGDLSNGSLQQVLMYGKQSDGTLRPMDTTSQGRQIVDVIELTASGKISTSTALSSVQMCGYREDTGNSFHTFKVASDGTMHTNLFGYTDVGDNNSAVRVGCDTAGNLSTLDSTLNAKISKGDGVISAGSGGIQQNLMYGKDASNNLDPLKIDAQGHLEITVDDVSANITNELPVQHKITRGTVTVASPFVSGGTSSVIDVGDKKNFNFHMVGAGGSHSGFFVEGSNDNSNFVKVAEFLPQSLGGSSYIGGSVSKGFRYYRIENGGADANITFSVYNLTDA